MKNWRACFIASAVGTLTMSSAIAVPPLVCGANTFPTKIAQGYSEGKDYSTVFSDALRQYQTSQQPIFDDLVAWQAQKCPESPPCTNRVGIGSNGREIWSTGFRDDEVRVPADEKKPPIYWYVLLTNEYSGGILCTKEKVTVERINRQITHQVGVPPAKVDELKIPELLKAPAHGPLKMAPPKPAENMEKKVAPPK